MRRLRIVTVSLALLAAAACSGQRPQEGAGAPPGGSPPASGASPVAGGRLVYALSADTAGFNPVTDSFGSQGYSMATTIIEPLVAVDAQGRWKPYLAESVTPNANADEWTITVREGVSFSNGEKLDGEVVRANLEAQKASPLTSAVFAPVGSFELAGPMTVKVKLRGPWVAFPYYLASQVGMVVPKASLADPEGAGRRPVGTGPFLFKEYQPGNRMVVTKNPAYWRKGLPYLDEIEFRILPDSQTRAQTLEAGGVDAMATTRDDDITKFGALGGAYTVHRASGMAVPEYVFILNTAVAPLDDLRVRRALVHALDRQAFSATLRAGLTEVADGPWSKDSPWYAPGGDYPAHDPARAAALIKEVEAEKGPVAITLHTTPDPNSLQGVELAQDMWRKAGVDVTVKQADQADMVTSAVTGRFNAMLSVSFSAQDPDGEYIWLHQNYARPVGEISINTSRIKDLELSAALDSGRSNPQPEVRKQAYATVQKRLRELVPYIFVDHLSTGAVIARAGVRGIGEHTLPDGSPGLPLTGQPTPHHPFGSVWLSRS
ncbi:ABC transporter substrate-binding protein [Planomonospora corallina]|uniref:ABC transporter substrate-binding protein n=1 Tax=Planomonospora corallina TaxID=1806052 RepID=A0ABV8I8A6_9ACTN